MGTTQSIGNIPYNVLVGPINAFYNLIKGPPTNAELVERRESLLQKGCERFPFVDTRINQAIEYIDRELKIRKSRLESRKANLVKIIGEFGFSESDIDNSPDKVGKVINSLTIGEYHHVVNQLKPIEAALSGNYQG